MLVRAVRQVLPAPVHVPAVNLTPMERITEIEADTILHQGFASTKHFNISACLAKKCPGMTGQLNLLPPAVLGDSLVLAGSQERDQSNYLMQISFSSMLRESPPLGFNPISNYFMVPSRVQGIVWQNPATLICSMEDANGGVRIQIYHRNRQGLLSTNLDHPLAVVPDAKFREIKTNYLNNDSNIYLADSAANKLHIIDERGNRQQASIQGGAISSIKFMDYGTSILREDGCVLLFDNRLGWRNPAQTINMGLSVKQHTFAHEWYNNHNILVGGKNGKIFEFDSRTAGGPGPVAQLGRDPYVYHIGDIEYNELSRSFITSGMGDFTYWKHQEHRARLWAHSESAEARFGLKRGSKLNITATYSSPNVVVSTASEGSLGIHFMC